jgi:hypothetical protein
MYVWGTGWTSIELVDIFIDLELESRLVWAGMLDEVDALLARRQGGKAARLLQPAPLSQARVVTSEHKQQKSTHYRLKAAQWANPHSKFPESP